MLDPQVLKDTPATTTTSSPILKSRQSDVRKLYFKVKFDRGLEKFPDFLDLSKDSRHVWTVSRSDGPALLNEFPDLI